MGLATEFKEFASKGNVMDLAVGVIIGAAFGKIVTSLVNDVIMPPVTKVTGGVNFADKFYILDPSKGMTNGVPITTLAQAKVTGTPVIAYGQFINDIISFLIVAAVVFVLVKKVNQIKSGIGKPEPSAAPSTKECPYCASTISIKATRCPNCTSALG